MVSALHQQLGRASSLIFLDTSYENPTFCGVQNGCEIFKMLTIDFFLERLLKLLRLVNIVKYDGIANEFRKQKNLSKLYL